MSRVFASYATKDFEVHRDSLCESAINVGFDDVLKFGPDSYRGTKFEADNISILSQGRGAGYWLWKPWIILRALETLSDGDVLVYSDAGRSLYYKFNVFPAHLIEIMWKSGYGFLLGPSLPQHGPLSKWTKRDCITIIDGIDSIYTSRPLIQATWSIWTNAPRAIDFLKSWLEYCQDERCLTDQENVLGLENFPDFVDHRHDQSVLSLLAYKSGAPFLRTENTIASTVLSLRRKSQLAHLFLKRMDDAEYLFNGCGFRALIKSFVDLKRVV